MAEDKEFSEPQSKPSHQYVKRIPENLLRTRVVAQNPEAGVPVSLEALSRPDTEIDPTNIPDFDADEEYRKQLRRISGEPNKNSSDEEK